MKLSLVGCQSENMGERENESTTRVEFGIPASEAETVRMLSSTTLLSKRCLK